MLGSGLEVRQTRDRELLREFLDSDRLFAAYALCDLDEREFGRTRWGVALDRGRPVAVVLEYGGLSPQPLFVMGDAAGVTARSCGSSSGRAPRTSRRARSCWRASAPSTGSSDGPPMVRMWVDRTSFRPAPASPPCASCPRHR